MKISIIGAGYVGFSLACLLSTKHKEMCLDVNKEKVKLINNNISPIKKKKKKKFFSEPNCNLKATINAEEAIANSSFIIIATPTDYDTKSGYFDTSSIESSIKLVLKYNEAASVVIKSTIPIGFTDSIKEKFNKENIFYSPEFLRENNALYDNFYPSRIIVGSLNKEGAEFGKILQDCAKDKEAPLLQMYSKEAEAVKLFSNTYLAMRIAFFNELDSFCEINNISTKKIIDGMGHDPRIGNYYNNPSFGYGGYCLPKDTQQLLANFNNIPNNIIRAVVESNKTRKDFIIKSIMDQAPKKLGIYRLVMKIDSDNFRESAVLDIISSMQKNNVDIILYEPFVKDDYFEGIKVIKDLNIFLSDSDLILANRLSGDLNNHMSKVYSRDIYNKE